MSQLAPDSSTADGLHATSEAGLVVQCGLGSFRIRLFADLAPETCAYFSELAKSDAFRDASVFRIVTGTQTRADPIEPIHVVQIGTCNAYAEARTRISHEGTRATGLRHHRYTVSAARYGPGEVYGSFFICMRDEPALDYGGRRHADGLGFAAFGEVIHGHDVVERINQRAESYELLSRKVAIHNIHPVA